MSLVLPIPAGENTLLVTENDLGRGFNIENGVNAKKSEVFICEKGDIKSTTPSTDLNSLTLIRDNESLKSALNVGGELSLSYGLISGKVMGNYIDTSTSSNDRMTFLFTRRIVNKIVELDYHAKPSEGISQINNIDSLRSEYGLYYISKIEYGAVLDLKITLESSDQETMNQLKGELEGSITIGLFSVSVKAHIDKEETKKSSKIRVTSSVLSSGCKLLDRTDVKNFDDAMKVIELFRVDPDRLVPVRMEVSPIPSRIVPILSIDAISLDHYKTKLSQIGSFYWEFQQMIIQLDAYKKIISPLLSDEELAIYLMNLFTNVAKKITSLEEIQNSIIKFIQSSMQNILNSEIPCSDAIISQIKVDAQQMIGSIFTETDRGRWIGPTINKIPTYKGTYKFNNGSKYEGFCLDGKCHGKGTLTYFDGNIDQIKTIEGIWENDNVSFPSKITYIGGKIEEILDKKSLLIWRNRLKKKISDSLEFSDFSNSNEFIYNYYVNVDLIKDENFKDNFYKDSLLSLSERQRFNYLLLGLVETGKTTMIELFINVLCGQIDNPKQLRSISLEQKRVAGQSKTKNVCRYNIEYHSQNTWMFGITLIDTPGLIDSGDSNKDYQRNNSIISMICLERVDCIGYVINGDLSKRKTNESSKSLSSVLSILPDEAFECLSTIISFCDDKNQAIQVRNESHNDIKDKPAIFMDNPWSQHPGNKFKHGEEKTEPGILLKGSARNDITNELKNRMKDKTTIVQNFFIDRIRSKSSFKLGGPKSFLFSNLNTKVNGVAFFEDKDGKNITTTNNEQNQSNWSLSNKFSLTNDICFIVGSVFSSIKLSLEESDILIRFTFEISKPPLGDVNKGADGFAFVIQSNDENSLGTLGEGIGYHSIPKKDGCVAVEFDTHMNDGESNSNHISIQGCSEDNYLSSLNKYSLFSVQPSFSMVDGLKHMVEIKFNQKQTNLSVSIDNVNLLNNIHVPGLVGLKQAYFGFTSATGSEHSKHSIINCEIIKLQRNDTN
ncbi:hypothetical protein RB653_005831 [Dictyostelium firmibasis]|uniref:Legume lectin domain-containing protein n=1 Tax=Dictyostelium firmibasis TaxID=79012 RepID=A0AAN7ULP8_9MYCE